MHTYTLFDTTTPAAVPHGALAVAGYVDGQWPSLAGLRRRFRHAAWLSIATSSATSAMVLDVEQGDASPQSAAEWVQRERRAGVPRPCIYVARASVKELLGVFLAVGVPRSHCRLWVADWTGGPHTAELGLLGADNEAPGATQWTDNNGAGYDTSLTTLEWLHAVSHDYRNADGR